MRFLRYVKMCARTEKNLETMSQVKHRVRWSVNDETEEYWSKWTDCVGKMEEETPLTSILYCNTQDMDCLLYTSRCV